MVEKRYTGSAARPIWDTTDGRYTFQYLVGGVIQEDITLFINPENLTQTEPSRISVTQTKGGAFVDNFGAGIKTIAISGVTGYGPRRSATGRNATGQDEFLQLRDMYRNWLEWSKENAEKYTLRFYNWADDEAYEVVITQFSLQRSVGRPLLYQYNIQMTCIKNLNEDKPRVEQDITISLLMSPRDRASLISNQLTTTLSYFNNILAGVGLSNLASAEQSWVQSVSGGSQFLDSVSETYVTFSSVINDVQRLSNSVKLFVGGVTTFITLPFDTAKNLAITLGDAIETMCSVADVPHLIVRSFRGMICAIQALPKSLFTGFTNPDLFEGSSNCGSTLGIPDALVAGFSNSFTATAQVPSQRLVSQAFWNPSSVLSISEEPLQIVGVFLSTDIGRTGSNYLDSYRGTKVTLTSVPSLPVVVDYLVQQDSTQSVIQLETSSGYIVKSGDTPARIALNVYDEPSQWKKIVLYNSLEYPYIEEDLNFQKEVFATGVVRFYRQAGNTGVITIPKGSGVYVPEAMGTSQIDFVTSKDMILDLMQDYIDVPIIASLPGSIGNVASGLITGFLALSGITKVYNDHPTLGGKLWKVAKIGEVIQIPGISKQSTSAVIPLTINYDELFGIDIWVNEFGEFDSSVENDMDFARVFGVSNLVQALGNRIKTGKGFYPYNFSYGTNLPKYIGKKSISNWHNLIKVDIKGGVLLDPRVSSVKSFLMEVDGDIIEMSFDVIPINQQSQIPVSLIV